MELDTRSIPGYTLIRELGRGGMGAVWLAIADQTGEQVAIKFIRPSLLDNDAKRAQERFIREATIGVRLTNQRVHPNLLPILAFGTTKADDADILYIVMKYCDKGDLREYSPTLHNASPTQMVDTFLVLADALSALHHEGTLHRDIKPVNVLVEERDGTPWFYISDYGLAKSSFDKTLTHSHGVVGDLRYMSPEHLRGARYVNEQSDLFSFGVMMYEVLTDSLPFWSEDAAELRKQITELYPDAPSRRRDNLAAGWDTICLGLLAKRPQLRYATAEEVIDDLNRLKSLQAPRGPGYRPSRAEAFGVGDVVLSVAVHVGGNGNLRYHASDGFENTHTDKQYVLPPEMANATENLIQKRIEIAKENGAPFEDRPQIRIEDYEHGITNDSEEAPHPLRLTTSVTNYFATQRSNAALTTRLPNGQTLREVFATDAQEYHNSQLSNPICVNLSIVTKDRQICAARRGKRVGINPGIWAPAVSGTGNPEDCMNGRYDPFVAAIREAKQEVFGSFELLAEHITFFGFARTLGNFFPFLFGEVRFPYDIKHLLSLQPSDRYEVNEIVHRTFEIEDVTDWVREMYHETNSEGKRTATSHTTILSVLQSLMYEYNKPDDFSRIIDLLNFTQPAN